MTGARGQIGSELVPALRARYGAGLKFPVVPRGDEENRFQISADHTPSDIDQALDALASFSAS